MGISALGAGTVVSQIAGIEACWPAAGTFSTMLAAAVAEGALPAGAFDEDTPHRRRRRAEEVGAVLPGLLI